MISIFGKANTLMSKTTYCDLQKVEKEKKNEQKIELANESNKRKSVAYFLYLFVSSSAIIIYEFGNILNFR